MVIAFSFLGAAVLILVVAYFIGYCLPEHYEGEVLAYIHKPLHEVWDAVLDHEANPLTGRLAQQVVTEDSDGMPQWTEQLKRTHISVTTTALDSPLSLSRHMREEKSAREAFIEYRLQEANQGCRITITNRMQIPKGSWKFPMFRLLHSLEGASTAVRAYVNRLANQLGEPARFE